MVHGSFWPSRSRTLLPSLRQCHVLSAVYLFCHATLVNHELITPVLPADARTLPGISQPFPNIFDPLNFLGSAGSSNNPIRDVRRWRESELTHGRVAMLAALGIIVQEQLIETKARPFPFVKGTRLASLPHRCRCRALAHCARRRVHCATSPLRPLTMCMIRV